LRNVADKLPDQLASTYAATVGTIQDRG